MADINDHLVLIGGESASGKSVSLQNIENPQGVLYLNCESGKRLPFRAQFEQHVITDPLQVFEAFDYAEGSSGNHVHTIVIDSLTYLLDMYESVHVLPSSNTMKAWGEFSQYFKVLMQKYVAASSKTVIFSAHTLSIYNEGNMAMETKIPVKGALKNNGIESYFSVVLATKKVPITALESFDNGLLTITEDERNLGFKYVYQTRLTKETVNERIRGPIGLFESNETYIDNDIQLVMNRLDEYYGVGVAA